MINDVLTALGTAVGMFIYFLGIASACCWHIAKNRWLKNRDAPPINWNTMGIVAGVSAMVLIVLQNTQFSAEVQECQREFNTAITEGRRINTENDDLSIAQRKAFLVKDELEAEMWMALLRPPAEIARLDINNPTRQQYGLGVVSDYSQRTAAYSQQIRDSQIRQEELKRERELHPLPSPTCGK